MQGFTLWFTGLPSAGKSTISEAVAEALAARGRRCEILDGDVIRTNLSKGLGFSREDRDVNVKRVGFVCNLLARNGTATLAALVSPYRETRDAVRAMQEAPFIEVFVDCPVEVCAERDVKGLYARSRRGELKGLTGVDDPYEQPESAEITCHTDRESLDACVAKVLAELERRELLAARAQVA